jgi:hypothetical protein
MLWIFIQMFHVTTLKYYLTSMINTTVTWYFINTSQNILMIQSLSEVLKGFIINIHIFCDVLIKYQWEHYIDT